MTITEARIVLFGEESEEEAFRFEQTLGNTYTIPTDRVENLVDDWRRNQDDRMMMDLAGLVRFWEQDQLNRIREEQESSVMNLVTLTWNKLRQLMRGARQVEDGNENAHELAQWTMDFVRRIADIGGRSSVGTACSGNARCKPFVCAA
jgi:hypothetical protein